MLRRLVKHLCFVALLQRLAWWCCCRAQFKTIDVPALSNRRSRILSIRVRVRVRVRVGQERSGVPFQLYNYIIKVKNRFFYFIIFSTAPTKVDCRSRNVARTGVLWKKTVCESDVFYPQIGFIFAPEGLPSKVAWRLRPVGPPKGRGITFRNRGTPFHFFFFYMIFARNVFPRPF